MFRARRRQQRHQDGRARRRSRSTARWPVKIAGVSLGDSHPAAFRCWHDAGDYFEPPPRRPAEPAAAPGHALQRRARTACTARCSAPRWPTGSHYRLGTHIGCARARRRRGAWPSGQAVHRGRHPRADRHAGGPNRPHRPEGARAIHPTEPAARPLRPGRSRLRWRASSTTPRGGQRALVGLKGRAAVFAVALVNQYEGEPLLRVPGVALDELWDVVWRRRACRCWWPRWSARSGLGAGWPPAGMPMRLALLAVDAAPRSAGARGGTSCAGALGLLLRFDARPWAQVQYGWRCGSPPRPATRRCCGTGAAGVPVALAGRRGGGSDATLITGCFRRDGCVRAGRQAAASRPGYAEISWTRARRLMAALPGVADLRARRC